MQTITLDVRGQVCPATLLVALENMNTHRSALLGGAAKLHIMTDNREATVTIPGTARAMGYTVAVVHATGYYTIEIWRTTGSDKGGLP
ncbi:MAG: hypothetical protein A2511_00795 [Deltaproteobacteria bacterium RIFOXYD12_FULL_50_9]|nr:MAG: hypothetical protein A2511_00795 [Deltaproteobacteria bacterium RIFOXYD12_FULL_50_9]